MALITLPSPIFFPGNLHSTTNTPNVTGGSTIATGNYMAYVMTARENMVVSHVAAHIGLVVGASATMVVTLETLDATGLPSGTPIGGSSSGTSAALVTATDVLVALGASATIAKGTSFAVKFAYGTGSTSFIINNIASYFQLGVTSTPYLVTNTGSPTKSTINAGVPCIGLASSATTFYNIQGFLPSNGYGGNSFNNSTAGAKRGMLFTPPLRCRAVGMRFFNSSSAGDYNLILMDNSGAELSSSSTAFDGDHNAAFPVPMIQYFDNAVTLSAGTPYRAVMEPTTTTNITVGTLSMPANYMGSTPGGSSCIYTTFTTAGGWIDSATTTVPLIDILIDQVDDGTGTGGVAGVVGG